MAQTNNNYDNTDFSISRNKNIILANRLNNTAAKDDVIHINYTEIEPTTGELINSYNIEFKINQIKFYKGVKKGTITAFSIERINAFLYRHISTKLYITKDKITIEYETTEKDDTLTLCTKSYDTEKVRIVKIEEIITAKDVIILITNAKEIEEKEYNNLTS